MEELTLFDVDDRGAGKTHVGFESTRAAGRTNGVRITERDLTAIGWIAEQHAVRADVLARLLGADAPLSASRTRAVVARWRTAGLVHQRRVFAEAPSVIWPTREGQRLVRPQWSYRAPTTSMLPHHHAVSVVRLALEERGEAGGWTCERALIKDRLSPSVHVPDGAFVDGSGAPTAVEVELTQKSSDRLRGIVRELCLDYPKVLYAAGDRTIANAVAAAVSSLGEEHRVRITHVDELWTAR